MMRLNRHNIATTLLLLTIFVLTACDGNSLLTPKSGGKPYEVLVVGDCNNSIYNALFADVEGLPQPEPSFDISTTDSAHFNNASRLARNIVIVDINSTLFSRTSIKYEKDVYAKPQIIIYVNTPSEQALSKDITKLAPTIRMLLTRNEINIQMATLKRKHNYKAETAIKKTFGTSLWIPADMNASKRGKDFMWFSNNAATGMQNICIFSIKDNREFNSAEDITTLRDSVMRMNIKGETDRMFMKTVKETVTTGITSEHGHDILIARGLWEMENDDMGGPFVEHIIKRNGKIFVIEAFLFAPEMNKRNKLRQLEASLYTFGISMNKNK